MRVFLTVATYALGKQLGIQAAADEFLKQCTAEQSLTIGGTDAATRARALPAARTVRRINSIPSVEVALCHMAATSLPQMRSRAAWAAWQSGCEVWCTLDDDVECTTETLVVMLLAMATEAPRIVALPCRIRGEGAEQLKVNVGFAGSLSTIIGNTEFRPCRRAGTGLMLTNRAAMDRLQSTYADLLAWRDDADGQLKPALFEQYRQRGGGWFGEDYSFVMRARKAGVEVLAPVAGYSNHDGLALDLRELANLPDSES